MTDLTTMQPQTLTEAIALAERFAKSGMVPKDYQGKPDAILVAWQLGAELGLQPMQSLQNVAVINGTPSIWGDAALALVKAHPDFVDCEETLAVGDDEESYKAQCVVTRRDQKSVSRTFSVADAKRAGLWDKPGPWKSYPKRMLQLRARGFALRDAFPDALRGVKIAEEIRDTPLQAQERDVTPEPPLLDLETTAELPESRSDQVKQSLRGAQGVTTGVSASEDTPTQGEAQKTPEIEPQEEV